MVLTFASPRARFIDFSEGHWRAEKKKEKKEKQRVIERTPYAIEDRTDAKNGTLGLEKKCLPPASFDVPNGLTSGDPFRANADGPHRGARGALGAFRRVRMENTMLRMIKILRREETVI